MAFKAIEFCHYLLYIRDLQLFREVLCAEPVIAVRNDRPASVSFTNFTALDTL